MARRHKGGRKGRKGHGKAVINSPFHAVFGRKGKRGGRRR